MSRSRAQVFRGAGYQLSRRQSQFRERQQLRQMTQQLEQPPAKRTLAERVLPWRRRKATSAETTRRMQRDQLKQMQEREATVRKFRREHRQMWKGIMTVRERMRLKQIGMRTMEGEAQVYDHPQRRRMERQMRVAAWQRAEDERYGVAA